MKLTDFLVFNLATCLNIDYFYTKDLTLVEQIMNRTFLLLLMIFSALMIFVMGGHQTQPQSTSSATPWDVHLENNKIRVFGVILNKTSIQDANQIFSSFSETLLIDKGDTLELIATYKKLNLAGLIADIELTYQLNNETLEKLKENASLDSNTGFYRLSEEQQMILLDTVISRLTYKPAVDYEKNVILQRFGTPDNELNISDHVSRWIYLDFGLEITIDQLGPDTFSYAL